MTKPRAALFCLRERGEPRAALFHLRERGRPRARCRKWQQGENND